MRLRRSSSPVTCISAPTDSPTKPPLDWVELQSAMAATTNPATSAPFDTSPARGGLPESKLMFTAGKGDLGVLVPSIHAASVDFATNQVTLTGVFGPTLGTAESYGAGG